MTPMLSRRAHRALLLVTTVARLDHKGAVALWVTSPEICAAIGKPLRWPEPDLQALTRAGVLLGRRGAKGGYRLNRTGGRPITAADVVLAVTSDRWLECGHLLSPWLLRQEEEFHRILRQTTVDNMVAWAERREQAA